MTIEEFKNTTWSAKTQVYFRGNKTDPIYVLGVDFGEGKLLLELDPDSPRATWVYALNVELVK